jgi:ribosome-associated toxin RatA of RatAB toxin-antitoxin module
MIEIGAPIEKVWNLVADPKEFAFWAPNVRELDLIPRDSFGVDTTRHFKLDVNGKIETLDMNITHCKVEDSFAETPVGGTLKIHEKVEYMKLIYRFEPVDKKTTSFTFTVDYEMKGFLNKMLEKVVIGAFTSQLRLWFERLKTYAETGRPV